jgi:hypothetical protein
MACGCCWEWVITHEFDGISPRELLDAEAREYGEHNTAPSMGGALAAAITEQYRRGELTEKVMKDRRAMLGGQTLGGLMRAKLAEVEYDHDAIPDL